MLNIEKYKGDILNTELTNITCCVNHLSNKGICFKNCKECKEHAMKWLLEEYSDTILDDAERKYLSAVIRPFRSRVQYIVKWKIYNDFKQFIHIELSNGDCLTFPNFKADTMYRGMEVDKFYTLQELGL